MIQLRPYQEGAIAALFDYWHADGGNGLIVLPTGAGKSLVVADIMKRLLKAYPRMRIFCVTHTRELIVQNFQELLRLWPQAPAGIYSAGVGRRDTRSQIIFCGVQSVFNKVEALGPCDLLLVDECFPAGTMIATPTGPAPIETLQQGDIVFNATGVGFVEASRKKPSNKLVRLELSDGTSVECTPNHPFFTEKGWVEAGKLARGSRLFSRQEVRALLGGVPSVLRRRRASDARASLEKTEVLLDILLQEARECHVGSWRKGGNDSDAAPDRPHAEREVRERKRTYEATAVGSGLARRRMGAGASCAYTSAARDRMPDIIQNRCGEPGDDDRDRIGWGKPFRKETGGRSEEGCSVEELWVVGVSHQEQERAIDVFNIQVSGHPSYYAGGVLVHNCHLIPRNADTMYGKFIEALRSLRPDMRIAGLTATPYRLDSGRLDTGRDALFDAIVYEANVIDLIEAGYLSPLISKASVASMDVAGLGTRAGEFIQAQVEQRAMAGDLVERAVSEMIHLAGDRRAWLTFCASVAHAEAVRDALRTQGIPAESVDGSMAKGDRDATIRRFREGQIRALCSVNVLSIGFNVPHVDLVALMRPTKSTGLYIQQVGRGFRRAEGKADCLVLDFAKVVRMHGPVDAVVPSGRGSPGSGGEKAEADTVRAKECPECNSYVGLSARSCKHCGHEFPAPEAKPKHEDQADDSAGILSTERVAPKMVPVVSWSFHRHEKVGSPDSVRVVHTVGLFDVPEWLAFEHGGYARQKACQWWTLHRGRAPFPADATEALARLDELTMPETVNVQPDGPGGKYLRIVARTFARKMEAAE